jgi:hypothetical protein
MNFFSSNFIKVKFFSFFRQFDLILKNINLTVVINALYKKVFTKILAYNS